MQTRWGLTTPSLCYYSVYLVLSTYALYTTAGRVYHGALPPGPINEDLKKKKEMCTSLQQWGVLSGWAIKSARPSCTDLGPPTWGDCGGDQPL